MGASEASMTEYRLTAAERAIAQLSEATSKIVDVLAALSRLEERHVETRDALSRAFNEVSEVKREVSSIRIQVERLNGEVVPLKESRQWMVAGLLGVVALVGAAVIGLVLIQR